MEPTEKGIVIEKVMEMPEKQVEKVLIFIAGLEAGRTQIGNLDDIGIQNRQIPSEEPDTL